MPPKRGIEYCKTDGARGLLASKHFLRVFIFLTREAGQGGKDAATEVVQKQQQPMLWGLHNNKQQQPQRRQQQEKRVLSIVKQKKRGALAKLTFPPR